MRGKLDGKPLMFHGQQNNLLRNYRLYRYMSFLQKISKIAAGHCPAMHHPGYGMIIVYVHLCAVVFLD